MPLEEPRIPPEGGVITEGFLEERGPLQKVLSPWPAFPDCGRLFSKKQDWFPPPPVEVLICVTLCSRASHFTSPGLSFLVCKVEIMQPAFV